ncbi:MAG: SDR family oxidoreductase [Proteobacteria bacterium]|nr:SDR family oxidoreductase [Pseudomonadota bacterium]
MDLGLRDKTAILTGATGGIGSAVARALAAEGARLVLAARTASRLKAEAQTLRVRFSTAAATVAADLSLAGAAERVAEAALSAFGRIDVLINCAGSAQGGVFWEIPDAAWTDGLALKFLGTVRMMRAVLPAMRGARSGRIVTVVGNSGRQPDRRRLPASAANAALLAVTKGLADEVAEEGIVVLAVNPGPVRTDRWNARMAGIAKETGRPIAEVEAEFADRIAMKRIGDPDEIGRWIAFLASDRASFVTGTSVTLDGGMTRALA